MKYITKHFKGHYKELILGPLFKLLEAVMELFVPLVMATIMDIGIANQDTPYILSRGVLLFVIAALSVVAAMLCQYFAAKVAGAFGRNMRNDMFRHIMRFSGNEIGEVGTSALIVRLTNDISQVQTSVNMVIRLGSRAPFLAIGSIIMAMTIDIKIGMIFLLSTPIIILVLYIIMKKTLPQYRHIQGEQDKLSRLSAENLEGARVIRAFSKQKQEQQEYERVTDYLSDIIVRTGRISAALSPITTIIVNIAIAVIVWMGANAVNDGVLGSGKVVALVSYMNQTLLALIVAAQLIILFTRGIASAKRIVSVMGIEPSIQKKNINDEVQDNIAVRFDDVTFSYHKSAGASLENISFSIMPGEMAGLIGGTGSGKTTIINLIMRYFDTQKGNVIVNGKNIKGENPEEFRKDIALVPQKAVLFSGTIRHNLLMSMPKATEEQLWDALETAQAKSFVDELPKKLDSVVEEGGHNFSGGQRQRLTIARAVLRKPSLLILDDSASALDLATDAALRIALKEEMDKNPGMTVFIIGQRVSTIKTADQIIVLDDGKISGIGKHEELIQYNADYREICQSQGIDCEVGNEVQV